MEEKQLTRLDSLTRYSLIILAVTQGYALYFLHWSLDNGTWPATDLRWLKGTYTLVIALPAFFYLGLERLRDRRNLIAAAALAPILFFLGWHLGWVESGQGVPENSHHSFTPAFALALGVSLFILAMFFRTWCVAGKPQFDYGQLLGYSWQQALTLGLLGLFVGMFWLLLLLWGGLFRAIDIDFFAELFDEPAFVYPVTWLVLGLGVVLIRQRIRLVATVQFMCEALIKALLPLASVIVLLFFAALPFTGLQPIWDTGKAASLLMVLTLVLLFFANAVFNGRAEALPYPAPVRWFIFLSLVTLPIGTFLAAWALWLRIDQYGLTLDRLWAATIQLLIAGFTLSYAVIVLWKRHRALGSIQVINRWLALFVIGVLVTVNTPLADLRNWAAQSQTNRLLQGEVAADEFDYTYLRFSLGAYGVERLNQIEQSQFAKDNPVVGRRIMSVRQKEHRWSKDPIVDTDNMSAVAELIPVAPFGSSLPEDILTHLVESKSRCLTAADRCFAVKLPTSEQGPGWLLFSTHTKNHANGSAYANLDGRWLEMGRINHGGCSLGKNEKLSRELSLKQLPGPFLAYSSDQCLYSITPTPEFLQRLIY